MKSITASIGVGILSVFLLTPLIGCTKRLLDFTIVSSKQMDMSVKPAGKGRRVSGKDGVYWLFTIPLGTPNLKEAVDRAIEKAGPSYDALIDGVIYTENYWYLLSGYSGYKIVGTPIKTSELKAELLRDGKEPESVMTRLLFHSSCGVSNDTAFKNMRIVELHSFQDSAAETDDH